MASKAAAAAGRASIRQRSSGYNELKGAEPYRATMKSGIEAKEFGERGKPPSRNQSGQLVFKDAPTFRPVLTPEQIIRLGAFGGTYWRPIVSAVTGEEHRDEWKELPTSWYDGVALRKYTRSWASYDASINKYGVKCGGSLDMWESSGWISNLDPYGWFQWYCRFFQGRRTDDDDRQISRWGKCAGPSGRFRNQLIGKCSKAQTTYDDYSISPVIRQSLMHWGYELNPKDAEAYIKKKRLPRLKVSDSPEVDFATLGMPAAAGKAKGKAQAKAADAATATPKASTKKKLTVTKGAAAKGPKRKRAEAVPSASEKRAKKGSGKKKK